MGTQNKYEYKAEMKQLLDIIIHSLYTHPEVFLRELISNASDALNKLKFKKLTDGSIIDPDAELLIKIDIDSKEHTFYIEDNGIGMTEEEIINNIGTVAKSGTLEFVNKLKEENKPVDENLIGKFGVGFYSVFMVTDEVTIETRYADTNSKGYMWKSKGEGTYTIEEIEKKDRGTKISFKLKDTAKEFAEEYKIKEIINKYSNFADFPIYLKKEKVNTVSALWYKKSSDLKENELNEFYKFITNDFDDPLSHLHISVEGAVNFKALLFIPNRAPFDFLRIRDIKSINLYSNKILIQDDCKDILPEYLRFTKGVVDTIDLPLNISREVTQKSPVMIKIKNAIIAKILAHLQDMANTEPKKYEQFYKSFGPLMKTGVNSDYSNRDKIIELLRFESTLLKKDELVSLKDYVSRMRENQKEIYYLSGEKRDDLEKNPNLEYFKKNSIEVLLLTEPVDIFIVPTLIEYDKKSIKSIDKADIDLMPEDKIEKPDDNLSKSLISLFKETLKEKIEDVVISKRLVDSAVTLVVGKNAMDPQIEKMMKMMNKETFGSKKILEINLSHPLIRNLSRIYIADKNSPLLKKCIHQLYDGALFLDGDLTSSTDFIKRMTELMEEATK
ncbi:MAG: molecular chaperone HtpG [Candidatus Firestonebacteria bacterium]|nr:molecular chaperone HtpG [Candidatus Firestonebacteria bacterium]